jgi:hypothetical protein
MNMAKKKFRFDFALSFAGAQRDIARKLRSALDKKGFKVFFDEDFEHEMLGKDGSLYLRKVYSRESRYCIILISKEYDQRDWPNLERESIQSRELNKERDILLPVNTDGYKPEWLPGTRFYFDLSKRSLKELVTILEEKAR